MYPARHFQQHDSKQLQQLVSSYPLATILMPNPQSQLNDVCRVPLLFDSTREIFIAMWPSTIRCHQLMVNR